MTAENRAAIRGLPARLGDRFIDVGICEQTMIGAAAGLALRGRIPVCHALATFLTLRAFEFIRTDVGIARLPVKLVGAVPGFLSEANGPTHQAIEDIALMRAIPGMQIVCPADEAELLAAMPAVLASDAPCYVRFNAMRPAVEHPAPFEMGRAEVLSEGGDVVAAHLRADAPRGGPGAAAPRGRGRPRAAREHADAPSDRRARGPAGGRRVEAGRHGRGPLCSSAGSTRSCARSSSRTKSARGCSPSRSDRRGSSPRS